MQTKLKSELSLLVVEDEPLLRELIVKSLQRSGFVHVMQASGGNEALRILEKMPCDLVLSDMRMPDGDGMLLLDSLRRKNQQEPIVIFLTGFGDLSTQECKRRGAYEVLAKPCPRDILLATIDQALGLSHQTKR